MDSLDKRIMEKYESRIKELESDVKDWRENFEDERHAYFEMLARVKELEEKLVLTHSDLTDVIAENIRLREAIERHRDQAPVEDIKEDGTPIYYFDDAELYTVLDKKLDTCK